MSEGWSWEYKGTHYATLSHYDWDVCVSEDLTEIEMDHNCTCSYSNGCCGQRVSLPMDMLRALLANRGLQIVPCAPAQGD